MSISPPSDISLLPVHKEQTSQALTAARMLIQQEFLDIAVDLPIIPFPCAGIRSLCLSDTVRVYNITKVVYDRREDALTNLLNVYSSLGHDYGLSLIIKSDSDTTKLYLAVRSYTQKKLAFDGGEILSQAVEGHFSGTSIELLKPEAAQALLGYAPRQKGDTAVSGLKEYTHQGNWGLSAAVSIPGLKDEVNMSFTQGIERFIDAMEGKTYTAVIIAEPFSKQDIATVQTGYENMLSLLSAVGKQQITISKSQSRTLSSVISENISLSLMDSLSATQTHMVGETSILTDAISKSESTSNTKSITTSESNTNSSTSSWTLSLPVYSKGSSSTSSSTWSESNTNSDTHTQGKTSTVSHGKSAQQTDSSDKTLNIAQTAQVGETATDTSSTTVDVGASTVVNMRNIQVERLMEKIESHLERIDSIQALGAWTAGAFFIAPEAETAATAASIYLGALRGKTTELGNAAIIKWGNSADSSRALALESLCELAIPRLVFARSSEKIIPVLPATLVSSKELALMMNLPRKSVRGVSVLDGVSFGREARLLRSFSSAEPNRTINLGSVYHLFRKRSTEIALSRNDFSRHVLVTGTTGTGKTTTIKHILRQLYSQDIPFLVLEPAKSEYGDLANLGMTTHPVRVFNVGKYGPDCLRLNPLVFPQSGDITLMEHIDRVCALFNAAFPMYAAMPQVLEEAVVHAYEKCRWDLMTSTYMGSANALKFPTLRDVTSEIEGIVSDAGFAGESRSTYVGALKTRINSLMRGSLGMTFGASFAEETPPELLFDQPCIINLSALGSPEKKAIVMGLLLIRLQEYRLSFSAPENDDLRHFMVVEEAHNLLKSAGDSSNMEMANSRAQAVEYFSNLIAEMRAYGQGFLIADQSASALDSSVQRNTNTKIAFCAPYEADRAILAGALSLDEEQEKALARLESRTAVVKQNDWADAVQCRIEVGDLFDVLKSSYPAGKKATNKVIRQDSSIAVIAVRLILSRLPGNQCDGSIDLNVFESELKQNVHLSDSILATWKKIVNAHDLNDFSKEDIEKALYAIPQLANMVRDAYRNTDTAEGLLTRLRCSIAEMVDVEQYFPVAMNTLLSFLLAPCASHPKFIQALSLIAKEGGV